jgi:hypothetical protein
MTYSDRIAAIIEQTHVLAERKRNGEKHLHWKLDRLHKQADALRRRAAQAFATINGWKYIET